MITNPLQDIGDDYDYLVDAIIEDEPAHGPFADQHVRALTNEELAIVIRKYPDVLDEAGSVSASEWADLYADADAIFAADRFKAQMRVKIMRLAREFLLTDLNAEIDKRSEERYYSEVDRGRTEAKDRDAHSGIADSIHSFAGA